MQRSRLQVRAFVLGLAFAASLAALSPAGAQVLVNDPPHTIQTLIHYVGRLTEIAQKYVAIYNQGQQIYNQYQQIVYQLQALEKLDFHYARNVVGTMGRMEQLLAWGELPSHMNQRVDELHRELFPGWQVPRDYWQEEEEALTASLDTVRETLRAQHEAHRTSVDHIRTLLELKHQANAAEGTEQVLEAIAGLVAFHGEVSTLSELSEATSADAATAYYSYQLNALARQARATQAALEAADLEPPPLVPGDGWGALPSWWH